MTPDPPVPQLDYRRTSRRPSWPQLPAAVRAAVAEAAGGEVASVGAPVASGFSGGFAAVVRLTDGRGVFAKAGSSANPHLLEAYAREAVVLARLPPEVPAPRLIGSVRLDADTDAETDTDTGGAGWQVLVADLVPGEMPLPWTASRLAAAHEACIRVAEALTAPPPDLTLGTLAESAEEELDVFPSIAAGSAPLPAGAPAWVRSRLPELGALVSGAVRSLQGGTGMHSDLRADNLLVDGDRATIVDWNWLTLGPAWADLVGLLPLARADGVDVDALVARSPLTRGVDPAHIDGFLAVIAAYMLRNASLPIWPGGTPAIRVHQRRYARTFLDWLAARRGWAA